MLEKFLSLILGLLGIVATTVSSPVQPVPITPKITVATTTPAKIATTSPAKVETKVTKTVRPAPKAPEAPAEIIPAIKTSTVIPVVPVVATTTIVNFEPLNQKAREATVNILCTSSSGGSFDPLSGSGVIIDPRGIILTNAHIGQFMLLENRDGNPFIRCVARTGSPATPKYTLKLLYISRQWVKDNYQQITSSNATGTGENDYALLQIVGRTDQVLKLETDFPHLNLEGNTRTFKTGDPALALGYPAGFLGGISIQRELYAVSSIIKIGERFTFRDGTVDVFSLGGSPVAQKGASGGGVVNSEGKLIGIIVTSTTAPSTDGRDLDAISIEHVNRSLFVETRLTLDSFIQSDNTAFSKAFDEEILPGLKKLLADELSAKNR
ncbi:MAG: trypsin-like peptidase domain-containing protein [Patescibacteria group bacterium]|mgnify:FL=1